jgi:hypothetical protein
VNTVDETTTLNGAKAGGAQLQVTNASATGSATGLSVTTSANKPPLTVSNNVLNPRLNAQYVGGFAANQLGRVALGSTSSLIGLASTDTQKTVSIAAPAKGFVRLDGTIIAYDNFSSSLCGDCQVYVRVHDDTTGSSSLVFFAEGGAGTHATSMVIPVTWVFPVSSQGVHTYSLATTQFIVSGGGFQFYNPVLTAQYIPFGATGSTSLTRPSKLPGKPKKVPAARG